MMNEKTRKLIFISVIVLLVLLTILSLFFVLRTKQRTKKNEENINALSVDLEKEIGGAIEEQDFLINYDTATKTIVIRIINEPFYENKKKAIELLSDKGINLCLTKYLIEAAPEVNNPEWNKQNGGTCKP